MFYQQEQVKGEPLFLADNTIRNAMQNPNVWDLEIIGIPARCNSVTVDKMMISFGDVDRDGKQDIVMGGKLRNDPYWCMDMVEDGGADDHVDEQFRLTYFKNTGTPTNPSFTRIKHGETGYPFGDIIMSGSQRGGTYAHRPYLGDVNGDSWPDLIVSRGGNTLGKNARFSNLDGDSEWGFEGLRYFENNAGNFVENTNVFPSDLDLYAANPPSSVGTSNRNHESGGASLM